MDTLTAIEKKQQQHRQTMEENRQKVIARKARTKRLIEHGAVAEHFISGSENMSAEEFKNALLSLIG